ncbi:4a-hydroxytetrahydrobiopterin dehydratase [Deinococcus irradiatisoli]|uniref:4a-hydroxytetrahydrobiopterin dehydratase n=1 Tax=Deinococcus irradiatisoli TaxID=2202254 RepID=A0A2Z3JJC3_9DEIO|nr:4a-hydroxytetrahydrobiopterin dehydratase [Deinococcus irradiatisoli]AWN23440.1 4a-hydroxytetrahydrobiopterin dehydratase [Deinococcus irradiatisoli]
MTQNEHKRDRLTDGDVQDLKPEGWWGDDGKLFRVFEFQTYQEGVDFALRVAELAEAQDHHPEITIFYKKVKVNYYTHETNSYVSGVTRLDLRGAEAVNSLYALPRPE